MSTWFDIKLRTMQKMFAANGNTIPNDAASVDYIAAMPGACNEALQLLSTAGKFIIKSVQIAHNPVSNLISDARRLMTTEGGTLSIEADGAKSMYVEVFGTCTVTITVGDTPTSIETITSDKCYMPVKRLIDNPDGLKVKVTFDSNYPLAIKNYALYKAMFKTADDIQPFTDVFKYDLDDDELAPSFYMLTDDPLVYEGNSAAKRYMQTSDFFQEGGHVLVLDRNMPGNYTVYYRAYPHPITSGTADDYELDVDPEVDALIPLYMASEIFKDDDLAIATSYRNEFEVGLQRLKDSVKGAISEVFESESGWI